MTDNEILERNVDLQAILVQYIIARPHVLDQLPDDFRLVILPDDDPELSWLNLKMLQDQSDGDKPIVIVRMQTREVADLVTHPPQIYTPIAA